VLAGLAYLGYRVAGPDLTLPSKAVEVVLFSTFCLTGLIAGVALFRGWINGAGRAWRTLAANSFGIYYVHPLILYPLAYVILGVPVPAVAKLAILVVVTLVGSLAVSALVLKRVPGLRRMF
jgi:peptidoglycan/LPS O-acetylase OafA/YrhL